MGFLNVKAVQLPKYHIKYLFFNDITTQVLSHLKYIPFTFTGTWHHLHLKVPPGQRPVFTNLPCTAEVYTVKDIGLGDRRLVFGPGSGPNKLHKLGHVTW